MTEPGAVLALDIGGTKIAAALVVDGSVVARDAVPTPAREGAASILSAAAEVGSRVAAGRAFEAVGVGSAGVIDRAGCVSSATDILAGWAGADVAGALRGRFGVPVTVVNDAHAHAVGEAVAGAGLGRETVLVMALGTGIGGGVVVAGRPLVGAHGAAGHLGHVPAADAAGLVCSCGRDGHLEPLASGTGIAALHRRLGGAPELTGRDVAEAAAAGDALASETLRRAGSALGTALGGLINVVDPDVAVIAGSVAQAGEAWWEAARQAVRASVLPALEDTPVVPAALGTDAALIGAAHMAVEGGRSQ